MWNRFLLLGILLASACSRSASTVHEVHDLTHPAKPVRPSAILAAKPEDYRFDLNKAALIVVDMQKYFLPPGAPGLPLVGPINTTLAAFRAANASVVWLNWGVRKDYGTWTGVENSNWIPPVAGTDDAAIYAGLDVKPTDVHVNKYRESGFYQSELNDVLRFRCVCGADPNPFREGGGQRVRGPNPLHRQPAALLLSHPYRAFDLRTSSGIRTLFFAGINADECVFGSMLDAVRCAT